MYVLAITDLSIKASSSQYCPRSQGLGAGVARTGAAPVNNSGLQTTEEEVSGGYGC